MVRIPRGRRLAPPALLFVLLVAASCGGGDSVAPEDTGPKAGPVTQTITPDGGTVTAYSSGGASFTLTFPQDAVRVPTPVTVRPLSPSGTLYALAALEPAGMIFYEPIEMSVTAPEGTDMTDAQMILSPDSEPIYLPTAVDGAARTLSTTLRYFGTRDDSLVVIPGGPAAAAPAQTGGGNNVGAMPVPCSVIVAATQQAVDGLIALGTQAGFRHALELADNTAALLSQANCSEASQFIDQLADIACQGLQQAIDDAANNNTSTYGEFNLRVGDIVAWAGITQRYGGTCPADFMSAISGEITDFFLFFDGRLGTFNNGDYETFQDLKGEAQTVFKLIMYCQQLGLADAEDLLQYQAFNKALDKMRKVAYGLCVSDGWHYPLSRLTSTGFFSARDVLGQPSPRPGSLISGLAPDQYAGFSNDDIYEDLEYCATCLELDALATGGGSVDTTVAGGNGAPGMKTSLVTIDVPTRGTLKLKGVLAGFTCWDGTAADDEIVVEIDGIRMRTLSRSGGDDYIAASPPVDLDIETAVAGGLHAAEGSTSELTVTRKITDCDYRLWAGEPDTKYELVSATINWKNPSALAVNVSYPDSVNEGDANAVTVTVDVIDQFGVSTPTGGIDVGLNVVGGSAQQTSGTTDANGRFQTSVTATGATLYRAGDAAAPQATMTITADATSFEGLSEQAQHTTNVRVCGAGAGYFRQGGNGTYTRDLDYGHAKVTATAVPDQYSYGSTEWIDPFVVHVDDPNLTGQRGYVYIKVHYRMTSTGYSDSRPAARIVIGPRNGYSSPFFWEVDLNTPSSGTADIENDWEIPISCSFNQSGAPLDVNCDAFAKSAGDACYVTAEVTWMGISKITTQDGTPVSNYWLCSGSKTDYTVPQ